MFGYVGDILQARTIEIRLGALNNVFAFIFTYNLNFYLGENLLEIYEEKKTFLRRKKNKSDLL